MKKIIAMILVLTILMMMTGCASFERSIKDSKSNIAGGLDRKVTIYDQNGNVIKDYEGKIDIRDTEYGNKVLFDLDGKRVVIYNAVVIAEEE